MFASRDTTALLTVVTLFTAACAGSEQEVVATDSTPPESASSGLSPAADAPPRIDYVSAARGAWLVSVSFSGAEKGPSRSQAFETYDGKTTPRGVLAGADPDAEAQLVYELPALTTFDRFAVPEVAEVPSAYVTFFREVEVWGSTAGPAAGFELLAKATLETHRKRGLVAELQPAAKKPVRFLKLVLRGGINDLDDKMQYQFSELIGNGTQQTVPLEEGFTAIWDTKLPDIDRSAGLIELTQDGAAVSGCHGNRTITGTVSGAVLRAQGVGLSDGTPSQYVLLIDSEGALRGTANINNGPFGLFGGPRAPAGSTTVCSEMPEPQLGCGSTVYVRFEFNSAELRPESEPVLSDLFEGLRGSAETTVIEGHTSSEGSEEYNQSLSGRRAQSVVEDLVRRGMDPGRISAAGKGESEPIASNNDEAGRSLNRRVEVECR